MRLLPRLALCASLGVIGFAVWVGVNRGRDRVVPAPQVTGTERKVGALDADTTTVPDPAIHGLHARVAAFDGELGVCYCDPKSRTLYRWKGAVLTADQLRGTWYFGTISGIAILDAKEFRVRLIDGPVRYRQAANGKFRPGYFDTSIQAFYEWDGVELDGSEVPEVSSDGKPALLKAYHMTGLPPQVIPIRTPAHLKEQPRLWKKS